MAKKRQERQVGFWEACRDVLIAALNKGQFPLACATIIVAILLCRMPSEGIEALSANLVGGLKDFSLVGWILSLCASVGWFIHARWQRRMFNDEMTRMARERNKWQEKCLEGKVTSSKVEPRA